MSGSFIRDLKANKMVPGANKPTLMLAQWSGGGKEGSVGPKTPRCPHRTDFFGATWWHPV